MKCGTAAAPGYCHIFETFLPRLRQLGVSDQQINTVMVVNPARALSHQLASKSHLTP